MKETVELLHIPWKKNLILPYNCSSKYLASAIMSSLNLSFPVYTFLPITSVALALIGKFST